MTVSNQGVRIPPRNLSSGPSPRSRMREDIARQILKDGPHLRWQWDLSEEEVVEQLWPDAPPEGREALLVTRRGIFDQACQRVEQVFMLAEGYWNSLDDGDEAK